MLAVRPRRMKDPVGAGDEAWRLLCGRERCTEEIATLVWFKFRGRGRPCGYGVAIPPGFKETTPGTWKMGNHARHSERQQTRRLRHSGAFKDSRGHITSMAHAIPVGTVVPGQRSHLWVTCDRCNTQSVIAVDRIIREVKLPEYTLADFLLAVS